MEKRGRYVVRLRKHVYKTAYACFFVFCQIAKCKYFRVTSLEQLNIAEFSGEYTVARTDYRFYSSKLCFFFPEALT